MEKRSQVQVVKPSNDSLKNGTLSVWTPDDKKKLAVVLGQVFDMQHQFGKTTGQIENIIAGFHWALKDYSVDTVLDGIRQYVMRKSDIPAPADIINIIDPAPRKPEFDRAYYVHLRKLKDEQGEFALSRDEEEYLKAYDEHMIKKGRAA
jgi:hypothetical protein